MKVAAIIPCHNSEKTIAECIESVLNQTGNVFSEVILIDNNSQDRSLVIAKSYPIKVLTCLKQSASAARNVGWKQADSSHIAFIDADTVLNENWLSNMLEEFDNTEVVAVESRVIPSLKDNSWLSRYRYERKNVETKGAWTFLDIDKKYYTITTAACIYKKDVLIQLSGFQEKLLRLEDTDLSYRASYLGYLTTSKSAEAYDQYIGTPYTYLIRSFKNGRASCDLIKLWGGEKHTSCFNFSSGKLFLIETIDYIFFKLGQLKGGYIGKSLKPHSLIQTQIIIARAGLNESETDLQGDS
jgi:glycosyltransferase involved in cell wall biosynthesis